MVPKGVFNTRNNPWESQVEKHSQLEEKRGKSFRLLQSVGYKRKGFLLSLYLELFPAIMI